MLFWREGSVQQGDYYRTLQAKSATDKSYNSSRLHLMTNSIILSLTCNDTIDWI